MPKIRIAFSWRPTPRHLAVPTAAIGIFCAVAYSVALVAPGPSIPRVTAAYFIPVSVLLVVAGFSLWGSTSCGWWLAWVGMWAVSFSGLFPFYAEPSVTPAGVSRLLQAGFMVAAGGLFFTWLSHPHLYKACFSSRPPPHRILIAMPQILIVVGASILFFDPIGRVIAPVLLLAVVTSVVSNRRANGQAAAQRKHAA